MSVAESIVMRAPIVQVGCRSACSARDLVELGRRAAAEGAAAGRHDQRLDRVGAPRPRAAGAAPSARSRPGSSCAPPRAERLAHERAARDEALLVGERDVDAGLERRQRRVQPGRADDGVEHDVRAALGGQLRDARRGPRARGPEKRAARRLGRGRVGQRDRAHAEALGLAQHAVGVAARGERADAQIGIVVADLDRLPADRAGAAEEGDAAHQPQGRPSRLTSRDSGLAEQRDDRERRGPGEEQRVDAVEHAAVARQQRARSP